MAADNPTGVKVESGVDKSQTDNIGLATATQSGEDLSQVVKQEPIEKGVNNRNTSGSEKTDVRDKPNNNDGNPQQISEHNPNSSSSSQTQNYGSRDQDSQNKVSSNHGARSDDKSRDTNTSRDKPRSRDKSWDSHSRRSKSRDRYRGRDRSRDRRGRDRSRERDKRHDRYRSRERYRSRDSSRDRYYSRDRSRDRYRDSYRSRYRDRRRSRERSYDSDKYQKKDWSQNKYDHGDHHSFNAEKQDNQPYDKPHTYKQNTEGKEAAFAVENQTPGVTYQSGSNLPPNTASLKKEQPYGFNSSNVAEPFKESNKSSGNDFSELFGTCDVDYRVPSSSLSNQGPSSQNNQTVSTDLSKSAIKQPPQFANNSSANNTPQQWQTSSTNPPNPLSYDSAYQLTQQLDSSLYSSQFTSTTPNNYVEPHKNREYCEPQKTDISTSAQGSSYNTAFYNRESSNDSAGGNTFQMQKMDYSSNANSLSKDNTAPGFLYEYPTAVSCQSQTPQQINQTLQQSSQSSIVSKTSVYKDATPDSIAFPSVKDSDLRFNQDRNYMSYPPPSISATETLVRNDALPDKVTTVPNSSSTPNLPPNNRETIQDKIFDKTGTNASQYGGQASSNNWQTAYNAKPEWNNRGSSSSLPTYSSDTVAGNVSGKEGQAALSYNSNNNCPPPNFNTNQYPNFFTQMPPCNMWQLPPPTQVPLQGPAGYMLGTQNHLNVSQSFQASHMPPPNPPKF